MQGDKELRTRVKLLGGLLGEVFKDQNGEVIYDVTYTIGKNECRFIFT